MMQNSVFQTKLNMHYTMSTIDTQSATCFGTSLVPSSILNTIDTQCPTHATLGPQVASISPGCIMLPAATSVNCVSSIKSRQ
jgi:hypothetical protein